MGDNYILTKTDYHQTLVSEETTNWNEPDINHLPYQRFCLKTKLQRDISRRNIAGEVTLVGQEINNMMVKTVKILQPKGYYNLTVDQNRWLEGRVKHALAYLPNHCVVFLPEKTRFPINWVRTIMPYLIVTQGFGPGSMDSYQLPPFMTFDRAMEGLPPISLPYNLRSENPNNLYDDYQTYNAVIVDDSLLIELNQQSNYMMQYDNIVNFIDKQINFFYHNGAVVSSLKLAESFNLYQYPLYEVIPDLTLKELIYIAAKEDQTAEQVKNIYRLAQDTQIRQPNENTGLYVATWRDHRFAGDITAFLLSRLKGDRIVKFKINDNLVEKHYIALKLNEAGVKYLMFNTSLWVEADNLDEARYAASLIEQTVNTLPIVKVFNFLVGNVSNLELYTEIALEIDDKASITYYRTTDPLRPWAISIKMDYSRPIIETYQRFNKELNQRLASYKLIDKIEDEDDEEDEEDDEEDEEDEDEDEDDEDDEEVVEEVEESKN